MDSSATTSGADVNRSADLNKLSPATPDSGNIPLDSVAIWGRTDKGEVFQVPTTHDMVHTLLDPRLPKTLIDIVTVAILCSYFVLYWVLPTWAKTPVFFVLFMFWRATYNGGIGWLLHHQSNNRMLTNWALKSHIFGGEQVNKKNDEYTVPSWLRLLVKQDLRARLKGKSELEIAKIPLEYKTWIVFRHFVDLVLMSDFVSYCLLATSVLHYTDHPWYITISRWVAGIILIVFNLWVKIDAHRVVKDYAWYWGDFFFLEDVTLTFDGVFEMAPHPMYSIGYAAYYGVSLMTSSMVLFAASILAHTAQFAFLIAVENPHIEKTYGTGESDSASKRNTTSIDFAKATPAAMVIFKNFNFTRTSDIFLVLTSAFTALTWFLPRSPIVTVLVTFTALFWRLTHTLGLGVLLFRQSKSQQWTKLHLKYGSTPLRAYQQWQAIYNSTIVLSYVSLIVVWLRELSAPFQVPYWIFRVSFGAMLIGLHLWTAYSIHEELGEYGWFFGDFFYIKSGHKLSYSGIYRYLNHPERLIGIAGVWGMALISYSTVVTFLAFVYTFTNIAFIQFVEKPHMRKLYGEQADKRPSGVSKNLFKRQTFLPKWVDPDVIEEELVVIWDKYFGPYFDKLESLRPHVEGVVGDTRQLLRQYPATMTKILSENVATKDKTNYSVATVKKTYNIGEPITVDWRSDATRSAKDWIGIYRLGENPSTEITSKSSASRWSAIDEQGFDGLNSDGIIRTDKTSGQVVFTGHKLFWAPAKYEMRYHHNGKHNVLAISEPFEIVIQPKKLEGKSTAELAKELGDLYSTCQGRGPAGGSGQTPAHDEQLSLEDNEVLARFTESIKYIYQIDLAPFVIQADGTLDKIATRLLYVDRILRETQAV